MSDRLPPPPDPMGDFEDDVPVLRLIVADLALVDPLTYYPQSGKWGCVMCNGMDRELRSVVHDATCCHQRAVNHRNRHATTPGVKP